MVIGITGSKGFIGKNLVSFLKNKNIDIIEYDLQNGVDVNSEKFRKRKDNIDWIIHLAGNTFIPESYRNPFDFYKSNINTTLNVLEFCRNNGCKICFASTYLYGEPEYLPIDEKHPVKPHSPYTESKKISEDLIKAYKRDFEVDGNILRLFNVYGKGQNSNFIIPTIIDQVTNGVVNLNNPEPKRDFIYINDVVEAFYASIINHRVKKKIPIYNIGYGESYSIKELISKIKLIADSNFIVNYSYQKRVNEIMNVIADINLAAKEIQWVPKINLDHGIKLLLDRDEHK